VVLRNPLTLDIEERNSEIVDETFRFLYVGQVEAHKGVRYMIDAFLACLSSSTFSMTLDVVGDGSLFSEVQELADNHPMMRLHGRVGRNSLPEIFRSVDMTVVPSLCYENSPTVIFESFAFGVPVLASNIEGIAELILEGENGVTFVAGGIEDLAEKMLWCVKHRTAVREMGERTKTALVGLSRGEYIDELLGLYGE